MVIFVISDRRYSMWTNSEWYIIVSIKVSEIWSKNVIFSFLIEMIKIQTFWLIIWNLNF